MTAEELWEKKEIVGCILVLLLFASGLAFFKFMRGGPGDVAVGHLTQIKQVGYATRAYDVDVMTKKGQLIFRERIVSATGKLERLKEKKQGDYFKVTHETLPGGNQTITSVGNAVPNPKEK